MPERSEVDRLLEIKNAHEAELLALPNVTGVDVGLRCLNGQMTDALAIRVFVSVKANVDGGGEIPPMIDNVPTDVIQETKVELQVLRFPKSTTSGTQTYRWSPLQGGISIGPCRSIGASIYAGTLGAIVKNNPGNFFALSNWHVIGVDTSWHLGDRIAQPSRLDGGNCPGDAIGGIAAGCLASTYNCGGRSVDAAISTTENRQVTYTILNIGPVTGSGFSDRRFASTYGSRYGLV